MIGWLALRTNASDLGFAAGATFALIAHRGCDGQAPVRRRDVAVNFAELTNRHQPVQSDSGLRHLGSTRRLPDSEPLPKFKLARPRSAMRRSRPCSRWRAHALLAARWWTPRPSSTVDETRGLSRKW